MVKTMYFITKLLDIAHGFAVHFQDRKYHFPSKQNSTLRFFKEIADLWPFTGFLQNRRKKLFAGAVPVIWLHDNIPSSSSCLLWWDNYPWYAANDTIAHHTDHIMRPG